MSKPHSLPSLLGVFSARSVSDQSLVKQTHFPASVHPKGPRIPEIQVEKFAYFTYFFSFTYLKSVVHQLNMEQASNIQQKFLPVL